MLPTTVDRKKIGCISFSFIRTVCLTESEKLIFPLCAKVVYFWLCWMCKYIVHGVGGLNKINKLSRKHTKNVCVRCVCTYVCKWHTLTISKQKTFWLHCTLYHIYFCTIRLILSQLWVYAPLQLIYYFSTKQTQLAFHLIVPNFHHISLFISVRINHHICEFMTFKPACLVRYSFMKTVNMA